MRRLVMIDLTNADMAIFEAYEAKVIPRLEEYGGSLETRVRSLDETLETHLLYFPNPQSFNDYLSDPVRLALASEWAQCGASSQIIEVEKVATDTP